MIWSKWIKLRQENLKWPGCPSLSGWNWIPRTSGVYQLALSKGASASKHSVYLGIAYSNLRARLNDHAGVVTGDPFHPEVWAADDSGHTLWGRFSLQSRSSVKKIESHLLKTEWFKYPLNRNEMPWSKSRRRDGSCRYHRQSGGRCVGLL